MRVIDLIDKLKEFPENALIFTGDRSAGDVQLIHSSSFQTGMGLEDAHSWECFFLGRDAFDNERNFYSEQPEVFEEEYADWLPSVVINFWN